MTRTIQSRVVALAGVGVFTAGAALALLSRHALLDIEQSFRASQQELASAIAASIADDILTDEQLLQGAADAPFVDPSDGDTAPERRALTAAARFGRLSSAICFASPDAVVGPCEPDASAAALGSPAARRYIASAITIDRPVVSAAIESGSPDRRLLLIVLPVHVAPGQARGAVLSVISSDDRRLQLALEPSFVLSDQEGAVIAGARRTDAHDTVGAPVGGTPWVVQTAAVSDAAAATIATFRRTSLWVAPALASLAMLFAWGIGGSIRRPVAALVGAAERIAGGDLAQRVPEGPGDEIGRLAAAFEEMRARLKASLDAREQWNAELERRVESRTRELRQLTRKVISAQEDERRRIARELHDETSQLVAALGMRVHTMAAAADPANRSKLTDLQALIDRMHDGLHRLIVNLRPAVLDDLGLATAVQWLAEQQLTRAGIAVRCELGELQDVRLPPEVEIGIFRILQEAIANVARHAGADAVLIEGSVIDGQAVFQVEDDGAGFDPAAVVASTESLRGVGLLGMRERAEVIGGRLTVDSTPGAGTRVMLTVPCTASEEVGA